MWPVEKVAKNSSNVDYFGMHYAALLQTDLHSLVKPGHCFKIFQKMYIWIYGMYKIQKVPVIYFCIYEKMLTDCSQFKYQVPLSFVGGEHNISSVVVTPSYLLTLLHVFTQKLKRWLCCCSQASVSVTKWW